MPGLTILADAVARHAALGALHDALSRRAQVDDYAAEMLFESPRLAVGAVRYPEYPIAVWGDDRFVAIFEGCAYGLDADRLRAELLGLAAQAFGGTPPRDALARFSARDGDFVAVLIDRDADAAIVLNDRYGRLPLYCATRDGRVVVSRDLGYVASALRAPELRRVAVAEFLLFGYPLGEGTLFEGVARVPAATVVGLPHGRMCQMHGAHDFDRKDEPADPARTATVLASALVDACRVRAAPERDALLSLSGGLDSRMVAGALRRAGVAARAVTHGDPYGMSPRDPEIAGRVAERLGMPWELYPLTPPTGADMERLLAFKTGANYLGMSRVMPYLRGLQQRHGRRVTFFTGDQGDRLLGDVRPVGRLRSERDLAEYILRRESVLPPDQVAAMTGVAPAALLDRVRERLDTYPERRLAQKYVHFLFYERAFRWMSEGEDRNRCHFWHVTPFAAPAVFETAMRVPDEHKAHHRLRSHVVRILAPEATDVPTAAAGRMLRSPAWLIRRRVETLARSALLRAVGDDTERRLRRWIRPPHGHRRDSAVIRCVRSQLAGRGPVREYLRPEAVEAVLADARRYRCEQFSVVLTVTSIIDSLATHGPSVLEAFRYTPMT